MQMLVVAMTAAVVLRRGGMSTLIGQSHSIDGVSRHYDRCRASFFYWASGAAASKCSIRSLIFPFETPVDTHRFHDGEAIGPYGDSINSTI